MDDITLWLAAETLEDAARVLSMLFRGETPENTADLMVANSITIFEHFAEASAEMAGWQQWVALVEDERLVSVEIYN